MSPGDIFTYSASAVFTLSESNVVAVSTVLQNDVELTSGQYSYDSDTNKVTVSASLTAGDTVEIRYTYYPNYSSTEVQNYTKGAIAHLSVNNFYHFEIEDTTVYPEPIEAEKNLIALVASVLIEPDNKSYALPDLRIYAPRDLPLHDKISKIIAVAKHNTHGNFEIL